MKKKKLIQHLAVFLVTYVTISPTFLGSTLFIGEPKLPQKLLKEDAPHAC